MTWQLGRGAARDVEAAFRFYREHAGDRVADRFIAEFERVADLLDENPGFGTPAGGERRTWPLRVFPYAIIYRPVASGIRILVVRHQRRDPEFGAGRW